MSTINYYLRKNSLSTAKENSFIACLNKKETVYQDELIKKMLRKNTTVTHQDIIVVLDLMKETGL